MKNSPELLEQALLFALTRHKGARRKGDGRPYILHPFSVVNRLFLYKESDSIYLLASAAVLHDLVEDTNTELIEIAEKFGYVVAQLVEELTSNKEKIQEVGKTEYLCQKMTKMSSWALVIKLIDRLDNVEDAGKMPKDFQDNLTTETTSILSYIELNRKKLTQTHLRLISAIKSSCFSLTKDFHEP